MGEDCFQLEQYAKVRKQGEGLKLQNWFKCLRHCGIDPQSHRYHELLPTPSLPNQGGGKELHSNVNKSLTAWLPSCLAAFTLAEVLITLGVIGVVAAVTMPTLVANHQKREVALKLKVFNSLMSQAFEAAKNDYGDYSEWDFNSIRDGQIQLEWLEKYLLPYIKTVETDHIGSYALVALPNGSGFSSYDYNVYFFCIKYSDCKKAIANFSNPRKRFLFQFSKTSGFGPYSCGWKGTREEFFTTNACHHICSKTNSALCAKLIQYDGWQIKDDYPW